MAIFDKFENLSLITSFVTFYCGLFLFVDEEEHALRNHLDARHAHAAALGLHTANNELLVSVSGRVGHDLQYFA